VFEKIKDPFVFHGILIVWALFGALIIWYRKMLAAPSEKKEQKMALMSPLIAFLLFFSVSAYIPQWVASFLEYVQTHSRMAFREQEMLVLSQLAALFSGVILLVGFSLVHSKEVVSMIWGEQEGVKPALLHLAKGCLYTLLTYPIVMVSVAGVHGLVYWFGLEPTQEQVAIALFKALEEFPWLFYSFGAAIVILVPFVEELLFRGFLQNYLGGFVSVRTAVIATSLVFASFHYAQSQAASNIGLMTGLFIYSYFMGLFYKRENSLWVTIGMHGCFNAFTLLVTRKFAV
jgi:membrane protease YdiL (CAAX protease family)